MYKKIILLTQSMLCLPIDYTATSIQNLIQDNQASCTTLREAKPFSFEPLSLACDHYLHPYCGNYRPLFVLHLPQAYVCGADGWIFFNNQIILDIIWQNCYPAQSYWHNMQQCQAQEIANIAVIAQFGHSYYFHYMLEILGRLALLEMHSIAYDYVYVPNYRPYMKESLELWGIDPSRIIDATNQTILKASNVIVPSLVSTVQTNGMPRLVHYVHQDILLYIKHKLLAAALQKESCKTFSKKVFISRKDAGTRKLLNEDEVFALFEPLGFQSYVLSSMSLVDQILLFHQADVIVGPMGSGLTNIMFCQPHVKIYDLFQKRRDCTLFFIAQLLNLSYTPIKTEEFIDAYDGQFDSAMPLEPIKACINRYLDTNATPEKA